MTRARPAALASFALLLVPATAPAAAPAKLAVKSVAASPSTASPGGRLHVTITVVNRGRRAAGRRVTLTLSADRRPDAADTRLGPARQVRPIARNAKVRLRLRATIPKRLPTGRWFVIACAGSCRASTRPIVIGPPPSTFDLIAGALSAHKITREQAVLYGVFASFADQRLPKRFRGRPAPLIDSSAIDAALRAWPDLSPRARATLDPFLIPPMYRESRRDLRTASAAQSDRTDPHDICHLDPHPSYTGAPGAPAPSWTSIAGAHVRVWFANAPGASLAPRIVAASNKVWAKVSDVMGSPHGDGGDSVSCRGGDDLIDFVVTDDEGLRGHWGGPLALTMPYFHRDVTADSMLSCPTESYVVFDPVAAKQLPDVVAHELFHVVQFDYSESACRSAPWLMESTATWIMDWVDRTSQAEHQFAPTYFAATDRDIRAASPESRWYASYVFWQFLDRSGQGRDAVKRAFDSGTLHGVEDMEDLPQHWADFAAALWNQDDHKTFADWDSLSATPAVSDLTFTDANAVAHAALPVAPLLSALSISYTRFTLDKGVRKVTVRGGPGSGGDLSLQAFYRVRGAWKGPERWSGEKSLCRDKASEDADLIVLIYANASVARGAPASKPPELEPAAICGGTMTGTITVVDHGDQGPTFSGYPGGTTSDKTATFDLKLTYDDKTDIWADDGSSASLKGSFQGYDDPKDCHFTYDGTFQGSAPPFDYLQMYIPADLSGATLGAVFTGKRTTHSTGSGTNCGTSESTDTTDEVADANCAGKASRDEDGLLVVTFDDPSHSSTNTRSCKGTLNQTPQ